MILNERQRRFTREYLVDLNAAAAARRAGYSDRTADRIGHRLLSHVEIAAAIQAERVARSHRTQVTTDRVIRELADMAFYDPGDIGAAEISGPADIAKLPEPVRRAIVGWSWDKQGRFTLKLSPKTPALDLLGRHLGAWKDKLEVEVRANVAEILEARKRRAADDA